eukprot:4753286-Amphidinium_carterae.1
MISNIFSRAKLTSSQLLNLVHKCVAGRSGKPCPPALPSRGIPVVPVAPGPTGVVEPVEPGSTSLVHRLPG